MWATQCANTNYDLRTQAEVDALGQTGCTSVIGGLRINDSYDITNLDGLANLTSVGRQLDIYGNAALTNIDGLAKLTSVGRDIFFKGNLYVTSNSTLTDCQGVALVLGWPNGPPDDNVSGTISIESNATGCNSVAEVLASVPIQAPSAPLITSIDYEDGKITLNVSVSNNGGAKITLYDATCTDGTNIYTGTSTSSPITVSGLTNGVAYTCTVTATNSVGTSSASAATDPITPEEQVGGLPIWLLYQATQ